MNWQKLIHEILESPSYKLSDIARYANCSHEYIRKLRVGKSLRPKFVIGDKLITLHFHVRSDLYTVIGEIPSVPLVKLV